MNLLGLTIALCFLVPSTWYAVLILRRQLTWTRIEAKVFNVNKKRDQVKATYVVDGRSRTAIKSGWSTSGVTVGDMIVVRYNPAQPFRHQVARPVLRTFCMIGLALAFCVGLLMISLAVSSPSTDDDIDDLPWAVLIGLGLVALAIGSWLATHQAKRWAWPRADGTITGVRESRVTNKSDNTTTVTYPVSYEFVDNTREATHRATTQTWFRRHEAGQVVSVRYDPADPDRSSDISTRQERLLRWAAAALLIAIGCTLVVLGYVDVVNQSAPIR